MVLTGKFRKDFFNYLYEGIKYTSEDEDTFYQGTPLERIPQLMAFIHSKGLWENNFYRSYRATGFKNFSQAVADTILTVIEKYNNGRI